MTRARRLLPGLLAGLVAALVPAQAAGPAPRGQAAVPRLASAQAVPAWLANGGKPLQPIRVTLRHGGPPVEAVIKAGDVEKRVTLAEGDQAVELAVPASEQPRDVPVTVTAAGRTETATVQVGPPRVRELHVLPHSHVDIGYTHRQEEVIGLQVGNLEKAMALAAASAGNPQGLQFKWNPEVTWTLDHFLRKATPEKREQLVKAVREGRVGVDALFANMLTALCRPEELARTLASAARIAALTGRPVESASTCDVPGWTWGIVPVLAQSGIRYFAVGPNRTDRVGTIHQWDDKPFYWTSQSGRERVLCWVVDNYHHHGNLELEVIGQVARLAASDYPYDAAFMFWVGAWPNNTVDNAPPDEQLVAKVEAWNAKYVLPRVSIALAADFFREFEKRHGARLPQYAGDLTPYWEDGAGSTARETALNRASSERLSQAETLLALRKDAKIPAERFDEAWTNVLLFTEHTWGADGSVRAPDDPLTLDQWSVKQRFALDADRQSRDLLAAALPPVRRAVSSLDVFNTTQWERTGVAIVPAEVGAAGILDGKGRPLPSQRLASGDLAFVAEKVPAFGARRYRIQWRSSLPPGGGARASGRVLETTSLRVELDPATGAVKSLRVHGLDHDFVDPAAAVQVNDFRYVLGGNSAKAAANGPVTISVLENGPLVASLRVTSDAPGCNGLVREVRVVEGIDRVELVDRVDRKAVREKDAVHIGFGFNVPGGTVRMETPWAVVRPNEDQLPGSNRNWFTVQRWLDVSSADRGITLAPLDAPLVEIGGLTANLAGRVVRPDRWMSSALASSTVYSWAQNNHWHTNYKADQPGETTFRYILRPHAGGYSAADAARFGMETSRPLVVAASDARSPLPGPLLSVSSQEVLVETVKRTADGDGLVVRLFGVSGKDAVVTLKARGRSGSAWLTDATEKPLTQAGRQVTVPAYGLVQLRLQ